MRFVATKHELQKGLNTVSKAVATKSTQAILGCILIECDDTITFTGNNTELGIKTAVTGDIEEKGKVAVESSLVMNIANKLPDGYVTISTDDTTMTIKSGKAKFQIPFRTGENFPTLPETGNAAHFTMDARFFKDIISEVGFAAADNMIAQKVLEGIYLTTKDQTLTATAVDGHMIAIRNIVIDDGKETATIVPAKYMKELAKIVTDDELHVYVSDNYFSLEFGYTTAITRVIDGKYIDTTPIIGGDYSLNVKIKRKDFLECIDRAVLLTSTGDKKPVIATVSDSILNIAIKGAIGSMDEDIDIVSEGKGIKIGFNPRFMIDILQAIEDEDITIYMTDAKKPIVIKDDESYTYLVLPVNFAE